MADVAKWLRQWIVTPPLAGSTPVIRPFSTLDSLIFVFQFFKRFHLIFKFQNKFEEPTLKKAFSNWFF